MLFLLPSLSAAAASRSQLETALWQLQRSTDTSEIDFWGRQVSDSQATTESEAKALVEALDHRPADQFARVAVSRSTAAVAGATFHQGMKSWVGRLDKQGPRPSAHEEHGNGDILNLIALVHAVGATGRKSAIPDLRKLLDRQEGFWKVIAPEAARALGMLGDEASFEKVMGQVERGGGATASGYGTKAIARLVKKIDEIMATYKTSPKKANDPRAMEIHRLAEEIGKAGEFNPKAIPDLRKLIHHENRDVRAAAAHSLIFALRPVLEDREVVLEMLNNRDTIVRLDGLRSLYYGGKTWHPSFLPTVLGIARADSDVLVRSAAIQVLGDVVATNLAKREEMAEAVPYLTTLLNDIHQNPLIRSTAFGTLRNITGRWYPYEGMPPEEKRLMEVQP